MQKEILLRCHREILPYIHRTPVLTSKSVNSRSMADVHFKCENFQKGGAYKMRGATNAVLQLTDAKRNGEWLHIHPEISPRPFLSPQ